MMSSQKSPIDQRMPHNNPEKKIKSQFSSDDQKDNLYVSRLKKDFNLVEIPEDLQNLQEKKMDELEIMHLSEEEQSTLYKPKTTSPLRNGSELKAMDNNKTTHVILKSHQETISTILEKDLIEIKTELKKKYYVPSFLSFFMMLIAMTLVLLAYSTTYL